MPFKGPREHFENSHRVISRAILPTSQAPIHHRRCMRNVLNEHDDHGLTAAQHAHLS